MRITDDNGILYSMLAIDTPDFARLLAAVGGRCKLLAGAGEPAPDFRLRLIYANGGDSGPPLIEVTVPGPTPEDPRTVSAYVARSRLPTPEYLTGNWQIHHPTQGPQMGFNTCQQVAKFLSVVPTFAEGWHEVWQQWMDARDPALFMNE